jgi:PEP-CTERM motif
LVLSANPRSITKRDEGALKEASVNVRFLTFVMMLGILLLSSVPASATAIQSDVMAICVPDPASCPPTTPGAILITAGEGDEDTVFTFNANIGNPSQLFHPTVVLEPDGTVSDIFGVVARPLEETYTNGNVGEQQTVYSLFFVSDPGPDSGIYADAFNASSVDVAAACKLESITCVAEGSGGPFDMGKYISSDTGEGFSASFTSDGDVPEPGSAGLVFGLGALGLCAWKRRRAAA